MAKSEYLDITGLTEFKAQNDAAYATKDVATSESDGIMSAADKAWIEEQKAGGSSGGDFLTDEEFLAAVIS